MKLLCFLLLLVGFSSPGCCQCGQGTVMDPDSGLCVPVTNVQNEIVKPTIETKNDDLIFTVPLNNSIKFVQKDSYGYSQATSLNEILGNLSSLHAGLNMEESRRRDDVDVMLANITSIQTAVSSILEHSIQGVLVNLSTQQGVLSQTISAQIFDLSQTDIELSTSISSVNDYAVQVGSSFSSLSAVVASLVTNVSIQGYQLSTAISGVASNLTASASQLGSQLGTLSLKVTSVDSRLNGSISSLQVTNSSLWGVSSTLTAAISTLASNMSSLTTKIQNCAPMGKKVGSDGTCVPFYGDGSAATSRGLSCAQIKADYPLLDGSSIRYINDGTDRVVHCNLDIGVETGKAPSTALGNCYDILLKYTSAGFRPTNGVFYILGDYSNVISTYCDFQVDKCASSVPISGGSISCANVSNGPCPVKCDAGYTAAADTVVCKDGFLFGTAFCNIPNIRDDFIDASSFDLNGGSYLDVAAGTVRIPAGSAYIVSKASFDSSLAGLTAEIRIRQTDGSRECAAIQIFGSNACRHCGYNFGGGMCTNYVAYGTDGLTCCNPCSSSDPIAVGTWRTFRFTRTSGGINRIYDNGVKLYEFTSTTYNSGKVSSGFNCVNAEIDYYWVIAKDLGTDPFPAVVSHTFGRPWTLAAKVVDDYSWACSDVGFSTTCLTSKVSPLSGNLFDASHSRTALDLSITVGPESGVHLDTAYIARHLSYAGQIKFLWADDKWTPAASGYAILSNKALQYMFTPGTNIGFKRNADYHFVVEANTKNKNFNAEVLCWCTTNGWRTGGYEAGLFMGNNWSPLSSSPSLWCHPNNDGNAIQMKSHYTFQSGSQWYTGQHSLLKMNNSPQQVAFNRLAVWVR